MADESEQKYTLVEFSKEEADKVTSEIQAVLDKHDAQFDILRMIDGAGTIQCSLRVFRRALVPKEEGVVSPIQADDLKDNGRNNKEETGETADAPAA